MKPRPANQGRSASRRPTISPDCPCGRPARLDDCCGRYGSGGAQAAHPPDAETLMRSRYTAYVRGDRAWLLDSWHPSTRPSTIDPDPPGWRWLGLDVQAHRQQDEDHATVRFVARGKQDGRAQRIAETSRFVREGGRWYYLDAAGDVEPS